MKDKNYRQMEDYEVIGNNSFMFQWCCDCHLRHIWNYQIVRGEKPEDDVVVIRGIDDRYATKLRKYYIKNKKKK